MPVENSNKLQQIANQIGYHGGIAVAGAGLLARYIYDLQQRCELLEMRVMLLEQEARSAAPTAPPSARRFEKAIARPAEVR